LACFYSKNKAPIGPNYTRYNNPEFDTEYLQLLSETDPIKRQDLFVSLQHKLGVDQPYILLFYDESIWIRSNKLENIKVNPLNHLDLRQAYFR
jgi:ABC-type transport system substrate-binding protein